MNTTKKGDIFHKSENKSHPGSKLKYICPMKCEGEKVYERHGDCPVWNMHLVLVDDNKNHWVIIRNTIILIALTIC
jgi:hypothetical protein